MRKTTTMKKQNLNNPFEKSSGKDVGYNGEMW